MLGWAGEHSPSVSANWFKGKKKTKPSHISVTESSFITCIKAITEGRLQSSQKTERQSHYLRSWLHCKGMAPRSSRKPVPDCQIDKSLPKNICYLKEQKGIKNAKLAAVNHLRKERSGTRRQKEPCLKTGQAEEKAGIILVSPLFRTRETAFTREQLRRASSWSSFQLVKA